MRRRFLDGLLADPGRAQADVRIDGAGEQIRILQNHSKMPPQIVERELAKIDGFGPPIADVAALDVVEAQQQIGQRRLARAGVAHHRDGFARLDAETHVAQHPVLVLIGEPDVIEFDGDAGLRGTRAARPGDVICVGVSSSLKTRSLAAIADCRMLYFSLRS